MRRSSFSALSPLALLALLCACSGGGTSSTSPTAHPYWAVVMSASNQTATCASVVFYERQNGGGWNGPIPPDSGSKLRSGESGTTEFTYRPATTSAQFRIQAAFFANKNCSGAKSGATAVSSTLTSESTLTARLSGRPGAYTISFAVAPTSAGKRS